MRQPLAPHTPTASIPIAAGAPAPAAGLDPAVLLRRVLRQWKLAVGVGVVVLALGILIVARSVPLYEAQGLVRVRPERSPIPGQGAQAAQMSSALMPGAVDYVLTQVNLARSERVLSPVVDSLGMRVVLLNPRVRRTALLERVSVDSAAPDGRYAIELRREGYRIVHDPVRGPAVAPTAVVPYGTPARLRGVTLTVGAYLPEVPDRVRFAVVSQLAALQTLRDVARFNQVRSTDLVHVAVRSNDPVYSARVVNLVQASFAAFALERARAESGQQSEYLERELGRTEAELGRSRQRLGSRQAEQLSVDIPLVTQTLVARSAENEEQLSAVRTEISVVSEALSRLSDPSALTSTSVGALNVNPSASSLVSMLATALSERDRLIANRAGEENLRLRAANAQIRSLGQQIVSLLQEQLKTARARERAIAVEQDSLNRDLARLPGRVNSQASLQESTLGLGRVTGLLRERWYLTQIERNSLLGAVQIIDPARPPIEPFGMRRDMRLLIALLLAGLLAVGVAVLMSQFDSTVLTRSDVERGTRLPVLGELPAPSGRWRRARGAPRPPQLHTLDSASGEAYRLLRSNVRFAREDAPRVVQVVAPSEREDHATVAANLAAAMALQGLSVALVDGDLRAGRLHGAFSLPQAPGLADVLAGRAPLAEALRRVPGAERGALFVLPAGTASPLVGELLGSPEMAALLAELRERVDAVVLDSPALRAAADATLTARLVDGVVIVARSGVTRVEQLAAAEREMELLRAPLLGVVLTDAPEAAPGRAARPGGRPGAGADGGAPPTPARDLVGAAARKRSAASLL